MRVRFREKQCRKKDKHGPPDDTPKPTKFADVLSADHVVVGDASGSRKQCRFMLVIKDRYTQWIQAYATQTKSAEESTSAFQKSPGAYAKPGVVRTDRSK